MEFYSPTGKFQLWLIVKISEIAKVFTMCGRLN